MGSSGSEQDIRQRWGGVAWVRIRTGRPYFDDPTSPYLASLFGKNLPHPVMDLVSVVLIAGKSDISFWNQNRSRFMRHITTISSAMDIISESNLQKATRHSWYVTPALSKKEKCDGSSLNGKKAKYQWPGIIVQIQEGIVWWWSPPGKSLANGGKARISITRQKI